MGYGELAAVAAKLEIPKEPILKEPKDFKILNKSIQRPDVPMKVNGAAVFGIDYKVPGMVYASIQKMSGDWGKFEKFRCETDALKINGVQKVLEVERVMGITTTWVWQW